MRINFLRRMDFMIKGYRLIGVILLVFATIIMLVLWHLNPSYSKAEFQDLQLEESVLIDKFYERESGLISKGELFDVKYSYMMLNNEKVSNNNDWLEIVVKTNSDIRSFGIETSIIDNRTGEKRIIASGSSSASFQKGRDGGEGFDSYKVSRNHYVVTKSFFMMDSEVLNDFYIKFTYLNGSEVHHLKANDESQLQLMKDYKDEFMEDSIEVTNEQQRSFYVRCVESYYAKLFYMDFDEWCIEMKSFMSMYQNDFKFREKLQTFSGEELLGVSTDMYPDLEIFEGYGILDANQKARFLEILQLVEGNKLILEERAEVIRNLLK